jgi:hypothetical protein
MYRFALPMIASASALALSGCGTGGNDSADAGNRASGRTENGQLTARVQGVDLKVNLPPPIRRMTEDNDFLYPGARSVRGPGQRFHSDDPIERLIAWYRAPARANHFTIDAVERQGTAVTLSGLATNGDLLQVRLEPGASGGTDGAVSHIRAD